MKITQTSAKFKFQSINVIKARLWIAKKMFYMTKTFSVWMRDSHQLCF